MNALFEDAEEIEILPIKMDVIDVGAYFTLVFGRVPRVPDLKGKSNGQKFTSDQVQEAKAYISVSIE